MTTIKEKNFNGIVAEVKEEGGKGIVTIAISHFGSKDSYGDIVRRGAFSKTFKEGGHRIKHVLDHKLLQSNVVGLPVKMYESEDHAIVESALNLEKQLGRDLFSDYKFFHSHGRTLEHSYMYQTMKTQNNKEIEGEDITELKMYEYSTVALGANENTPLMGMKSAQELTSFIDELEKRLKYANYSDERGKNIENLIKQLKEALKTESLTDQPPEGTEDGKPSAFLKQIESILKK